MNNKATIILAIAALAVLGLYLYKNATTPPDESSRDEVALETTKFENETYGFSFLYPDNLEILEYTPEYISVGTGDEESFASQVDIRIAKNGVGSSEDFNEFVYNNARSFCAADGPTGSRYCTDVEQEQPFETVSGLSGSVFYLKEVIEDFETGKKTTGGKGPFFVFNISANNSTEDTFMALIIQAPTALPADEVDSSLIRAIAESVRVDRVEM